jgi:hypothetical protein
MTIERCLLSAIVMALLNGALRAEPTPAGVLDPVQARQKVGQEITVEMTIQAAKTAWKSGAKSTWIPSPISATRRTLPLSSRAPARLAFARPASPILPNISSRRKSA